MPDNTPNIDGLEVLYHFTSPMGLSAILHSKHIAPTESNLNIRGGNCAVVWLTSSPSSMGQGLKSDNNTPAEYDKSSIRLTLPCKKSFFHWDEWSDSKGMDKERKAAFVGTVGAEETYATWYVSEEIIPIDAILGIKNMLTGAIISIENTIKSLSEHKTLKIDSLNPIDGYIMSQPENLQILLFNVRLAIRQALPDATEKISWQMPTFWQGRNLIHFAAQKNHLGIYPGGEAMKHFAPRLTAYKTSKGAIQFPYKSLGEEQMRLITEIAVWCGKENAK